MGIQRNLAAGAAGGLAGGCVMAVFMTIAKRTGILQVPLPVRVERWAEDRIEVRDRPQGLQEEALGQAGHLVFSAALGAAYGALAPALPFPASAAGPLYGAALYALNLGALGPAAGITKGPARENLSTAGRRMAMHVVFGTVTAMVFERLCR